MILDQRRFDELPYAVAQLTLDVARSFEVPPAAITGPGRTNRVALARQVAMTVIRGDAQHYTLEETGGFYNRDHGTVIHAQKVVARKMREGNAELAAALSSAYRTFASAREEVISQRKEGAEFLRKRTAPQTVAEFHECRMKALAERGMI